MNPVYDDVSAAEEKDAAAVASSAAVLRISPTFIFKVNCGRRITFQSSLPVIAWKRKTHRLWTPDGEGWQCTRTCQTVLVG